jgi:hypothetical protein
MYVSSSETKGALYNFFLKKYGIENLPDDWVGGRFTEGVSRNRRPNSIRLNYMKDIMDAKKVETVSIVFLYAGNIRDNVVYGEIDVPVGIGRILQSGVVKPYICDCGSDDEWFAGNLGNGKIKAIYTRDRAGHTKCFSIDGRNVPVDSHVDRALDGDINHETIKKRIIHLADVLHLHHGSNHKNGRMGH